MHEGGYEADMGVQSSVKNVFIRGSVVRYVHLPASAVDTALLEDATRRGMSRPRNDSAKLNCPTHTCVEAAQASAKARQG